MIATPVIPNITTFGTAAVFADRIPKLQKAVDLLDVIESINTDESTPEGIALPPVIAGGGPRDTLLDKPVKDYDIFWPIHRPWLVAAVANLVPRLSEWHSPRPNIDRAYGLNGYLRPEMLGVLNLPGSDIDIIFFDARYGTTPHEIVSTFDTSICRCWFERYEDYLLNVRGTNDFWKSTQDRHIWTYPGIQTRVSHLRRIMRKFHGYKLQIVDPDLAAQYAEALKREESPVRSLAQ